jgi:uncharacterized RDD family membrane protein YckC/DNA-directed RNA polymerase subunit M/transcription elongation factor TFIIS
MSPKTTCPECGKNYNVHPALAGQPLNCRKCGNTFNVPTSVTVVESNDRGAAGDESVILSCPRCGSQYAIEGRPSEISIDCDSCGHTFTKRKRNKQDRMRSAQRKDSLTVIPSAVSANSGRMPAFSSVRYAGFWIRLCAAFIDMVVMIIPVSLVSVLYRAATPVYDEFEFFIVSVMDLFINAVIWWIYHAVLESSAWQGTVGKKTLGLKVTNLYGNRISFGHAAGRYFAKFLSCTVLFIGYLMVGWTAKKQGLHDMLAGTLVVAGDSTVTGAAYGEQHQQVVSTRPLTAMARNSPRYMPARPAPQSGSSFGAVAIFSGLAVLLIFFGIFIAVNLREQPASNLDDTRPRSSDAGTRISTVMTQHRSRKACEKLVHSWLTDMRTGRDPSGYWEASYNMRTLYSVNSWEIISCEFHSDDAAKVRVMVESSTKGGFPIRQTWEVWLGRQRGEWKISRLVE